MNRDMELVGKSFLALEEKDDFEGVMIPEVSGRRSTSSFNQMNSLRECGLNPLPLPPGERLWDNGGSFSGRGNGGCLSAIFRC